MSAKLVYSSPDMACDYERELPASTNLLAVRRIAVEFVQECWLKDPQVAERWPGTEAPADELLAWCTVTLQDGGSDRVTMVTWPPQWQGGKPEPEDSGEAKAQHERSEGVGRY